MNIKKICLSLLLVFIIVGFTSIIIFVPTKEASISTNKTSDRLNIQRENTLNIVTTNFASYDFIRAIVGDKANVKFLMGPGKDAHSYEPTAQDIITIQKSDIFVYVGGELEKWSDKVLNSIDLNKTKSFCVADYIEFVETKPVDGAEEVYEHEEHEEEEHHEEHLHAFDEHIWSSPNNAIKMLNVLKDIIIEMDNKNKDIYEQNAIKYINEIKVVQAEIQNVVDSKVRDRLIFGDKMPMQYFIDEYNLKVSAAYTGCSTETEPSAATIAYLVNKVIEEKTPVVLYIELNTGKVAQTIADEANRNLAESDKKVEAMQIQTLHNVSKDDFDNGETYVSLMRRNVEVLEKALCK